MLDLNLTHLMDDAKCYEAVRQMRWRAGVCCPKCNQVECFQPGNSRSIAMLDLNLTHLMDDAKCYEAVRQMRWRAGVCCPKCNSQSVIKRGKDETQVERQRYQCKSCGTHFDDLTDTIFAGHHQPLRMWLLCLYLMGLNRSNQQIAQELDLDKDVVQAMTTQLRQGIVLRQPAVHLSGAVECDEVYVTAGHKGNPEAVRKRGAKDGAIVSKGFGVEAPLKRKSRRFSA